MSIIRNGGFERGSIEFWSVETTGTLEISTLLPKYGGYCGKYTSGGGTPEDIVNNDYVKVLPYDLVSLLVWVKNTDVRTVQPILYCYDADYSFIKAVAGYARNMDGTYIELNTQIPIMQGVAFIRAGLRISVSNAGEVFYIDGYTCDIIGRDNSISGYTSLLSSGLRTASGHTSGDKKDLQMYKSFEADISVTYAGGTNPTLDVVVYELDSGANETVVGTFAQKTAAGRERITLTHCTGKTVYTRYTIGGTNPEFVFKVDIAGKG